MPVHHFIQLIIRRKNKTKVFCIGDMKTGTQSLSKALKILGYRTGRLFAMVDYDQNRIDQFIHKMKKSRYDAYIDYPMGEKDLYKIIDKEFPESKFILTVRDKESFAKSYTNYFKEINKHKGFDEKKVKKIIEDSQTRNIEVQKYFKNRPDQLLVMNIIAGDDWEKLCNFLNKPIPDGPFPHRNVGKYRKKQKSK